MAAAVLMASLILATPVLAQAEGEYRKGSTEWRVSAGGALPVDLESARPDRRLTFVAVEVGWFLTTTHGPGFLAGQLQILPITDEGIKVVGKVDSPAPNGINTANGRGRIFVGSGVAYLVHTRGYNTFDVSAPASPRLLLQGNATPSQFGWKQVALNGSGLMIGATSPNQAIVNSDPYDARSRYEYVEIALNKPLTRFEAKLSGHILVRDVR